MKTTSLELCRELYELSGWESSGWYESDGHSVFMPQDPRTNKYALVPAYDLGFLLRKFPDVYEHEEIAVWKSGSHTWRAGYGLGASYRDGTPEDAAAKLAIELFKQGILK